MSHQQSFCYKGTGLPGLNQTEYYARINVSCSEHSAVTLMRLKPAAPLSQVKHNTTEPLSFSCNSFVKLTLLKGTELYMDGPIIQWIALT